MDKEMEQERDLCSQKKNADLWQSVALCSQQSGFSCATLEPLSKEEKEMMEKISFQKASIRILFLVLTCRHMDQIQKVRRAGAALL